MLQSNCGPQISIEQLADGSLVIAQAGESTIVVPASGAAAPTVNVIETPTSFILTVGTSNYIIPKGATLSSVQIVGSNLVITESNGQTTTTSLGSFLQTVSTSGLITGNGTPASPLTINLSGYLTQAAHDAALVPVYGNDSATILFRAHL
jgi:hypothetical protein